jgi:hypothetical protein
VNSLVESFSLSLVQNGTKLVTNGVAYTLRSAASHCEVGLWQEEFSRDGALGYLWKLGE